MAQAPPGVGAGSASGGWHVERGRISDDPAAMALRSARAPIGAMASRGGGKASALDTASPSARRTPCPQDVAAGLGLGACLTLSLALALEHSWLGAGTFTLVLACILACLHQDTRA